MAKEGFFKRKHKVPVNVDTTKSSNDRKLSKQQMRELIKNQKIIEESKKANRKKIEEKRSERDRKRKERNKCMLKLTSKGQPVMKHRIRLLLKHLSS